MDDYDDQVRLLCRVLYIKSSTTSLTRGDAVLAQLQQTTPNDTDSTRIVAERNRFFDCRFREVVGSNLQLEVGVRRVVHGARRRLFSYFVDRCESWDIEFTLKESRTASRRH